MTSYLIIGRRKEDCQRELDKLTAEHRVDPVDIYSLPSEGPSIGIEEVRLCQAKIMLRPIKSQTKAVIIWDSHLLTPPAQNALLKTLEEPPEHTILILISESLPALLPTIRSRCQIVFAADTSETPDLSPTLAFLTDIRGLSLGDRLVQAEKLARNKPSLLAWIETILWALSQELTETQSPDERQELRNAANTFQEAYSTLKHTNTNPRLTLEHLFLTAFDLP